MTARPDRTLMAAGLMGVYALVIGFTDNFVRVIAQEAGLWQFHFTRSCMAAMLLGLAAAIWGFRVRPRNWRAVLARSAVHGVSMACYFGSLAFLDVALAMAGLFTAPIWVLLIQRVAFSRAIGRTQVVAVALGFAGVVLVLGPQALAGASLAAVWTVFAGVLYGLGNIATREWCGEESTQTLLAGFFAALGVIGALGMLTLAFIPMDVPAGAAGFVQRGPVWGSMHFYFWTFVQAAGSLLAVGLMVRAYQITDAGRASVLEYMLLPASAFWTWVIWGQSLAPVAMAGMVLIAAAGSLIALHSDRN